MRAMRVLQPFGIASGRRTILRAVRRCAWRQRGMAEDTEGRSQATEEDFRVLSEKSAYSRYLTVLDRRVQHPSHDGRVAAVHAYDVVSSRHPEFCVVFPFHPCAEGKGGEVTLLREYAQGLNAMVYCLPSGGYDKTKHVSRLHCAQQELSEEARLTGGRYAPLISADHPGIPEVKWCANRFTPFLVIDPEVDCLPGERDHEEYIQIQRVDIARLKEILSTEQVLPPTTVTCYLAFEKLQDLGYL